MISESSAATVCATSALKISSIIINKRIFNFQKAQVMPDYITPASHSTVLKLDGYENMANMIW